MRHSVPSGTESRDAEAADVHGRLQAPDHRSIRRPPDPAERGALLRRERLYHSHLEYWHTTLDKAAGRCLPCQHLHYLSRYSDDFVLVVSGERHRAEALREEVAAVLAPLGCGRHRGKPVLRS